jgi:putative ABC transport system permease protein
MTKLTLAAAWSRKRRLLGTVVAIVLGVAFLSATLVIGDSARAGFHVAFSEANAGTDALVRSSTRIDSEEAVVPTPIEASLLDLVTSVDGVRAAVPSIEGVGQVLDADGEPIGGDGPPTFATNWIDDPSLSGWRLADGRAPDASGEIVIDRGTAEDAGLTVGDTATVLVPDPVAVEVVGIATFGDDDSIGGSTYVAFETSAAQQLLTASPDQISGVVVGADDGLTEAELVARLEQVLPPEAEAITGEDLTAEMEADIESDFLGFFNTALLIFAFVALLVATFTIFNTFSILVAQRTRESALLRAIGGSRRQVLVSALAEAAIVGAIASAIGVGVGLLLGAGLLALMESAGFGLPIDGLEITLSGLLTSFLVGMVVTLLGGLVPAWKASRVSPLAALRDVAYESTRVSRGRFVAGLVGLVGGGALVLSGSSGEGGLTRAGLGALVLLVGVILLGPAAAGPIGRALGAPLRLRGVSGALAGRNAVRNPRRTSGTAAALLVGVGVVSLFTVFGASVARSIEEEVDRSFGGDLVVEPAAWGGAGISTGTVERLAELPEVGAAAGLGFSAVTIDGDDHDVAYTEPAQMAEVLDLDVVEGDLHTVDDTQVAMASEFATDHGFAVGDEVEVGFGDGSVEVLELSTLYDSQTFGEDITVPVGVWSAHNPQSAYAAVLVGLADGVSIDEGRAAVEAATESAGAPRVRDRDEFVEAQAAELDALLTVIYGLLAVAILIALMGIANTLSLSVHERTRELGLLRAVGQTRSQLRAMVRWESVIVATFGAVGGLGLGLFLGWGLVRSLNAAEGFGTLAVPVGSLVGVLVVGAAVGVLAGLRPAWRASRLDVLTAVAQE